MPQTLDLSLLKGSPEQRDAVSAALLDKLKTRGVAKLKNHGLPEDLIAKMFDYTRQFFSLSLEDKMTAKHPLAANPNRGYSFVGQESISSISGYDKGLPQGKSVRDIKETLDMGSPNDNLVDNIWVADEKLPGFRKFMEGFYASCFEVELEILDALAKALDISASDLKLLHNKAENEFRLLHYPAVPASDLADGTATRIAEHTDFGTITMLFQDSTGGLQVEDQQNLGNFHDVESGGKSEIILNIGDSLQRLTNDTFMAACHRVTYPPTVKFGSDEMIPERYSVAYFAKPNRVASLLPLQKFVTPATTCKYEDITAWDYNNLRIAKLFS
ncbi:Oxoglutarate/iron-dependent dioxygenase [Penicillium fimorum]|uniref:Oxoglutarate/iron-dependent dioxygenase n=1 Tax=Penicillium fimorum TaxID=1882269 RepID=A0A9X0C9C3_9EURO|nr:Oxoglutarate/iron-dependent dioxygenase [Penicillium fimorum]